MWQIGTKISVKVKFRSSRLKCLGPGKRSENLNAYKCQRCRSSGDFHDTFLRKRSYFVSFPVVVKVKVSGSS